MVLFFIKTTSVELIENNHYLSYTRLTAEFINEMLALKRRDTSKWVICKIKTISHQAQTYVWVFLCLLKSKQYLDVLTSNG